VDSNFGTFLSLFYFDKRRLILSVVLSITQSISLFPLGLIVQYLFDNIHNNADIKSLTTGVLLSLILILFNTIVALYNKNISLTLIKCFISDLREKLIQKLLFLNTNFYVSEDLDRIHSQIVQDTERLDNMAAVLLTQLIPSVIVIIGLSGVLIYLNFSLFILLLLFLPIVYIVGALLRKKLKLSIQDYHKDFAKFSAGVTFILKFYDLIKISSAEMKEYSKQKSKLQSVQKLSKSVALNVNAYNTIQGNLIVISGFVVLLLGGYQVMNGHISLGTLISFFVVLNITSAYFKTIIAFIPVLVEGQNSINSLHTILGNEELEGTSSINFRFQESICFQEVEFYYGDLQILKNINFKIKKHQIFGISGESGSGKTTLIKLLLGAYPVYGGQILIDGQNINKLNFQEFRKHIGFLTQDPMFFTGTIYENLVYGLDNIDSALIEFYCNKCLIHDFIISLPYGYQTEIGNSGNKISGGQKQRLAIARALIRKPEILVLDEPDKNLDEKSVLDILNYIKQMKITTIIISHNDKLLSDVENQLKL
jgi:ABC-type bacteriocin/lantibiotic exporter with double-glycine peptidase domain